MANNVMLTKESLDSSHLDQLREVRGNDEKLQSAGWVE